MVEGRLENMEFDEVQVERILAGASQREVEHGDLTRYNDLIAIGVEAGLPKEYMEQEAKKLYEGLTDVRKTDEGELERQPTRIPARSRNTDLAATISLALSGGVLAAGGIVEAIDPDILNQGYLREVMALASLGTIGLGYLTGTAIDFCNYIFRRQED